MIHKPATQTKPPPPRYPAPPTLAQIVPLCDTSSFGKRRAESKATYHTAAPPDSVHFLPAEKRSAATAKQGENAPFLVHFCERAKKNPSVRPDRKASCFLGFCRFFLWREK